LMHTHGMDIPPDASESAVTPAPAPLAENAPTWGNSNAPPAVDLHNNGWGTNPAPSPAPTQESYLNIQMKAWTHRMASTGRTLIIRVIKAKAKRDQEAHPAIPLTPKESEDVTRMKMASVNVKSSKRLGTLMVRPLLKIGLSLC
jgi:hypothetical protein